MTADRHPGWIQTSQIGLTANPRTMLALTSALSAPAGRDRPAEDMTCQTRHRRLVADGDISAITRYAISAVTYGYEMCLRYVEGSSEWSFCHPFLDLRTSVTSTVSRKTKNGRLLQHALGGSDDLVGEICEAVTDGPVGDETQGHLVAGLADEAFAGPEHERVDHQP